MDLVDPQADIGLQPRGRVIAGSRRELPASGQFLAPSGEQVLDLRLGRGDAQLRVGRGRRPVHLVQRALGHAARQVVDLGLVPQLQVLEVDSQRARPAGAGRQPGIAEHPAEVGVGVLGLHPHKGRPNQSRIRARCPVSLRIVLSASPADALASTNPASTWSRRPRSPPRSTAPAAHASHVPAPASTRTPHLHPDPQAITVSGIFSRRVNEYHYGVSGVPAALKAIRQARSGQLDAACEPGTQALLCTSRPARQNARPPADHRLQRRCEPDGHKTGSLRPASG